MQIFALDHILVTDVLRSTKQKKLIFSYDLILIGTTLREENYLKKDLHVQIGDCRTAWRDMGGKGNYRVCT
jgi:hypothetical protein